MAILEILQYPNPRLNTKARQVDVVDDSIKKIIDDMFETHYNADNCAALAATQLDIIDPPAITVIDFSPDKNQPLCLVNPVIVERQGEHTEAEGCMSVQVYPVHEKVTRAATITVQALDRDGKPIAITADKFMAKCIQHEIDHLNGTLFIDHLSKLKRERVDKKIEKMYRILKQRTEGK